MGIIKVVADEVAELVTYLSKPDAPWFLKHKLCSLWVLTLETHWGKKTRPMKYGCILESGLLLSDLLRHQRNIFPWSYLCVISSLHVLKNRTQFFFFLYWQIRQTFHLVFITLKDHVTLWIRSCNHWKKNVASVLYAKFLWQLEY